MGLYVAGLTAVVLSGVFVSFCQSMLGLGKVFAIRNFGCAADLSDCPFAHEKFNNFGSYMASFGIGALIAILLVLLGFGIMRSAQKKPMPEFHFAEVWLPGCIAGLLWFFGHLFYTATVARGGLSTMVPLLASLTLVTSGVWGLVHYHEIKGTWRMILWACAVAWTVAAVSLLIEEKTS